MDSKNLRSFESEELLARCMGRAPLARRVLACFEEQFQQDLEQLAAEVNCGNASAVAMIAHRLKGAAANVAAPRLRHLAAVVEESARQGRMGDVPSGMEHLRREWPRFAESVSECLADTASAVAN